MIDLKKLFSRALASLALAGASASCAQAETPETAAQAEDAIPGPALWKLGDEDTTIYLFGTVHALPSTLEWYDERIQRAFAASGELVTEIDMADQAAAGAMVASKASLAGEQTLRELMTEEDRAEFEAALAGLGMPPAAFDRVEPWFAAMTLSLLPLMQDGYQPESGAELKLTAEAGDKTKLALETVEQQIDLFDSLPIADQLEFLDETVEAVPTASATLDEMVAAWVAGDADGLAEMMNAELDDEELYQRLLVDRNANWVDWIETRLEQPGNVFIAVGAGHLAGKGSVQDQLEQRGHTVTRIWQ